MPFYLDVEQIQKLTDAILSSGLNNTAGREELLIGINPGFVAQLPLRSTTLYQIQSDVAFMNGVSYLKGDEVPLKIWLGNAVHSLRRSFRPEQDLFQEMLNRVAAESDVRILQAKGQTSVPDEAGHLEQIIHQDDLLPIGWLMGALAVSKAVARLVVTRYEQGQPAINPTSGQPIRYKGTGWLIGKQYLITNHHVINARSEGELNAPEVDLRKQAENTKIQFDYDGEGIEGEKPEAEVETLSAWVELNATPCLDFAILKLKDPSAKTSLTLAPKAVQQMEKGTFPVNIIQHPGGNPKSMGIRNNLVSSLEELELRYFTDTMQGSSGSPVCNDAWQVVALHRATKYLYKNLMFQGKPTAWVNRGVRIDRIIDHLMKNHPELWTAIGATVL